MRLLHPNWDYDLSTPESSDFEEDTGSNRTVWYSIVFCRFSGTILQVVYFTVLVLGSGTMRQVAYSTVFSFCSGT